MTPSGRLHDDLQTRDGLLNERTEADAARRMMREDGGTKHQGISPNKSVVPQSRLLIVSFLPLTRSRSAHRQSISAPDTS
jgi:hypothetical protein